MKYPRNIIKTSFWILIFIFRCSISFSQNDTTEQRGTIKIAKHTDSTYIKVDCELRVFVLEYPATDNSYRSMVGSVGSYVPVNTSPRMVVKEARPQSDSENFDYGEFFRKNAFTKNIKMRKGESDTVSFYVSVDNYGKVKFENVLPIEKLGDTTVVYSDAITKMKYKVDVSHVKTTSAFSELTNKNWVPAKIDKLKKHPSKHKVKYTSSAGYTKGIITVMYSSSPFKD